MMFENVHLDVVKCFITGYTTVVFTIDINKMRAVFIDKEQDDVNMKFSANYVNVFRRDAKGSDL